MQSRTFQLVSETACVRHLLSHMFAHLACLPYRNCINQQSLSFQPLSHTCCTVCLSGISFHICLHILPANHTVSALTNAEPYLSAPLTHVLARSSCQPHTFIHGKHACRNCLPSPCTEWCCCSKRRRAIWTLAFRCGNNASFLLCFQPSAVIYRGDAAASAGE